MAPAPSLLILLLAASLTLLNLSTAAYSASPSPLPSPSPPPPASSSPPPPSSPSPPPPPSLSPPPPPPRKSRPARNLASHPFPQPPSPPSPLPPPPPPAKRATGQQMNNIVEDLIDITAKNRLSLPLSSTALMPQNVAVSSLPAADPLSFPYYVGMLPDLRLFKTNSRIPKLLPGELIATSETDFNITVDGSILTQPDVYVTDNVVFRVFVVVHDQIGPPSKDSSDNLGAESGRSEAENSGGQPKSSMDEEPNGEQSQPLTVGDDRGIKRRNFRPNAEVSASESERIREATSEHGEDTNSADEDTPLKRRKIERIKDALPGKEVVNSGEGESARSDKNPNEALGAGEVEAVNALNPGVMEDMIEAQMGLEDGQVGEEDLLVEEIEDDDPAIPRTFRLYALPPEAGYVEWRNHLIAELNKAAFNNVSSFNQIVKMIFKNRVGGIDDPDYSYIEELGDHWEALPEGILNDWEWDRFDAFVDGAIEFIPVDDD